MRSVVDSCRGQLDRKIVEEIYAELTGSRLQKFFFT